MRAVFVLLERAAATDASILLIGDTGTGKEVAVDAIVSQGTRRDGPLVVVDCGALPAGLIEGELFGHERGAFTGADRERIGVLEAADGGTVFLDEIGELPLDLQPRLLGVLERREVRRLGSTEPRPVDVQVIAATNRNLREEVNAGRFRADLYYRLAVMEIRLPSLAERPEDIPLLAEHLLLQIMGGDERAVAEWMTDSFRSELSRHSWPGNVRELRNYLARCVALGERTPITPKSDDRATGGPPPMDMDKTLPALKEAHVRWLERAYLEELLRRTNGNVTAAAKAAGFYRTSFYRLLARYDLR